MTDSICEKCPNNKYCLVYLEDGSVFSVSECIRQTHIKRYGYYQKKVVGGEE